MNNIQKINAVILRNSNIPPNYKTFNKKFKGYKILSLFNLYSGYNKIEFKEKSRDLTTFQNPLKSLQYTMLP